MINLDKTKLAFKRYLNDNSGSMAMTWVIAGVAVVFATGAAYDFSQVSRAKTMAQLAADNMALAASVAVDLDNTDKYTEGQSYSYANMGGPSKDFTNSITGVVDYDVTLPNSEKLIARATVNGTYTPAFISIMPWVQGIPFNAVSDVAYAASEKKPASILLVPDTSGSMAYDDETGSDRQTNLNNAAKDFMEDLETIVAGNEADGRILRTGMIPFYSSVWGSAVVDMDWGTISDDDIDYMYAGGGTNTASPMEDAEDVIALEQPFHDTENGYTAQRFVILMTDGANNSTSYDSRTETACTNMKNDGVIVYTIAYALTAQSYDTNSRWGGTYTPSTSELNRARTMLQNCASSPDHFLQTTVDFDISEVFDSIGVSVIEEVIRIRS